MLAISLALTASLSWGFADFLGGIKSRALPVLTVILFSQVAGLTLVSVILAASGHSAPGGDFAVWAALSALAGLSGLVAFYRGLAVGAMAVVAPISGLAAAVPVIFGLLTGERPSGAQGAGIVLALAGVALASRERAPENPESTRTAAGFQNSPNGSTHQFRAAPAPSSTAAVPRKTSSRAIRSGSR